MTQIGEIQVPSGAIYDANDCRLLELMNKRKTVEWRESPFTLNSGIKSHIYVFGREDITDNPVLEWRIGLKIAQTLNAASWPDSRQVCLIGIPTAGTAISQSAAMVSWRDGVYVNRKPVCHRIMRETPKKGHGDKVHQGNWVNGRPDTSQHIYVDVDNVVTDAESKFKARERLKESGYPIDEMPSLIFVDRQQGGIERMKKAGIKQIIIVYKLLDLTYALGEMNLWPKSAVKQVEEEIKEHQFK